MSENVSKCQKPTLTKIKFELTGHSTRMKGKCSLNVTVEICLLCDSTGKFIESARCQ